MKISKNEFMEELQFSLSKEDSIKLQLVLDQLLCVDRETQLLAITEIGEARSAFTSPMLARILGRFPSALSDLPELHGLVLRHMANSPSALLDALGNPDYAKKTALISVASDLNMEESIDSLLLIANTSSEEDDIKATVTALGSIGATEAVSLLSEFIYSGKRDLTLAAIKALGSIGTPSAIQRLAERMGSDTALDVLILNVFGSVQSPHALEKLNEALQSRHAHLRNYGKIKLTEIGSKAVPILTSSLTHDDPDWVIHALNVLGDIGDESAVQPIRTLLRHEPANANVRFAAYEALGKMSVSKGAFTMAAGLSDPVDHVAVAAAKAINRNFNPIFESGLANLVRSEVEGLKRYIEIIVIAEADKIFVSLAKDKVFLMNAVAYLKTNTPSDVKKRFGRLLRENGYTSQAMILAGETKKQTKQNKTVWAVDDSRMMLSIYKNTLFALGYEYRLFEFPASVLDLSEEEKPDLILTDLNMPEISGIDLTRKLRIRFSSDQLPIIMITTQSDAQNDKKIKDAGVTEILYKPFTQEQVGEAIAKYLS